MRASIITIGDEILLGQITDTNSRFAADAFARLGIETVNMYSIADDTPAITQTLSAALAQADVVLITGGLGPTKDDITKKTLADYFHTKLVFHEQASLWVKEVLSHYSRGRLNVYNESQAWLPEKCTLLRNRKGTASGMWFEREGKIVISLPGVPFEMENLLTAEVLPRLEKRLGRQVVRYKMLTVFEVPESELAWHLQSYEASLPAQLKLAYLPSPGFVRLRLTAKGTSAARLESAWAALKKRLTPFHTTEHTQQPQTDLLRQLAGRHVTVATAESCTGGNIAHLITQVPGASAYFLGGIVAYANEVKTAVLGVSARDLQQYGAVSEPVALQMAQGARKVTGADWAVATTGVAGPDGGTPDKPVGTVWIAVAGPEGTWAEEFHFASVRERNIEKASFQALQCLLQRMNQSAQ